MKSQKITMRHANVFSVCCDIQGNLFLPDQIQQVFLQKNLRQTSEDYRLLPGTSRTFLGWWR